MTRKEALSKAIMTLMYFQAHFCKSKEAVENTQAVIDALEQIEKEPKWIPVSERLPEERKKCLVAFKGGYVGIMCYASDLYRVDEYDFCDEKGMAGWFDYDRELGHYSRDDVIAWLPLLTPYKAEGLTDKATFDNVDDLVLCMRIIDKHPEGGGIMTEWDSSPEGKAYHRKAHQEWREKNREKSNEYHREYMKAWRELNKDRINQKTKEWRITNHEKVKEYRRRYMAKWRDEHREQYREYMKRWKESHPEGKDTHTMTKEEWLEKYGYPMGDTSGWENWLGWDTRIRKGAEE